MAFHGNRGSSRVMRSTSGSSRGWGGTTNGSRGRGRGRGSMRRGRGKSVFDSARLADKEEKESENGVSISSSEQEDLDEIASDGDTGDGDDAAEVPAIKPYAALLKSITNHSDPPTKKRKLETLTKTNLGLQESENKLGLEPEQNIDRVEEDEEGPETAIDDSFEENKQEIEDASDPFETHFANPDDNLLLRRLEALKNGQWVSRKSFLNPIGKAIISTPDVAGRDDIVIPAAVSSIGGLKLKQKLSGSAGKQITSFHPLEQAITPFIYNYYDLLFLERSQPISERLRRLACLHAINHVFKTRDQVIKNNARLSKESKNEDLDLRDQGFTRPKVLMLLPTRQSCVRMVNVITSLCEPEQQENRKRFDESYAKTEESFSIDKPEDFRELFGGNDDDMFRLGIKFTRKTVKYFSQFYNSDIIFASPLGLRMAIGTEDDKKLDYDFLSSIEIVIVDQADALLMQNWEHVEFIFEHLNLQPKEAHGCDFSRVRSWYLDNNARYFRQTIALAAFNTPELNTLFYNKAENWTGKVKLAKDYSGALQELGIKVKQTFSRLESPLFSMDPETRFTYFTAAIIPSLTRHFKDSTGTLIFVPSYLDFVRVRNFFSTSASTSKLSFGSISEYTSVSDVARARSHFISGRHSILLYTERAHHFRRYRLNGVRKVIMYGLPDNPIFYKEIVGGYLSRSVQEGELDPGEGSARVIFSKWDVLKLERVAGTERVGKMIREKGDTFDFL